jgi:hypothetical protein
MTIDSTLGEGAAVMIRLPVMVVEEVPTDQHAALIEPANADA